MQSAGHGEEQCHGVIGDLGGVHAGHVADEDAEFGGRVEIDRVDADTHPAHHLQLGARLQYTP